jgi:putative membrane protein
LLFDQIVEDYMKTSPLFCATALSALLFAGASSAAPDQPGHARPAPGTANDTMSGVRDTTGHVVGTISAEMTTTLKDFVPAAAVSDMYEVDAARIAVQRTHDAKIKAFAEKMIEAHTGTTNDLKAILVDVHGAPTPPAHLDDRRQGMIDELRGAKDADFDGRYLSQQVDAHNEALVLMRGYAKDGDTNAVKAFAAKTSMAVQMHLDMAQKLLTDHDKRS